MWLKCCIHYASIFGKLSNGHRTRKDQFSFQSQRSESESEVTQSCPTLRSHRLYSLLGFSVHGIFQARVLEWVAISFSRGPSWPRDRTQGSCIAGRCFTLWATREAQRKAMPKNVQTTAQLHSFHMLARSCSKSSKLGLNGTWTKNFQMYKLDLQAGRGTRDQIANIH